MEDLYEQLSEVGFTTIEIDKLDKEKIFATEIFDYVFSIPDYIERTKIIVELQEKAKELKVSRSFNTIFRAYQQEYVKRNKQKSSNTIKFTKAPIEGLKCGDWIADDAGVKKVDIASQQQFKASPIPILPIERLLNIESNTEKVKIAFLKDGKWQNIAVEKNTIASKSKIIQLANRGIEVNDDNAKGLITYLSDVFELNEIPLKKGVSHLGWVEEKFVPYSKDLSLDVDMEFQQKINCIREKGDYEKWKKYIGNLRNVSLTLRVMIASSFASVLVKPFNLNTFIVHLWGKSGNGKTVAEKICASIWGRPDDNLISNLSNTMIANERLCDFWRNIPVFLDELQIAKTKYKSFDELIYVLTEGKGKERGTVDNGIREQTLWQTIVMLTGEEPITTEASKEGVKNRVVEINEDEVIVEDGNSAVKFIMDNYGFAGQEFIKLLGDFSEAKEIQQKYFKELNEIIKYKKQVNSYSIILTADYIASKYIFNTEPLEVKDIKEYIRYDTDEAERYYNLIIDWTAINNTKFQKDTIGEKWGKIDEYENCYYINKTALCEMLADKGISFDGIKNKLFDKGYMQRNTQGKLTFQTKVFGVKGNYIKLNLIN